MKKLWSVTTSVGLALSLSTLAVGAATGEQEEIKKIVDASIIPLMKKSRIAGMAVGISTKGKHYVFNYGVVSVSTKKPVSDNSLFEIGSVSKTMTGTLASYAQVTGKLSFSDKTSKYLPELKGTRFGDLSLLNLATHTSGGLPLQLPQSVTSNVELMQFLKLWKPKRKPGTVRNYANPGIGMLGFITAKCMNQKFEDLMQTTLFSALGMSNSYIKIPAAEVSNYVQGYTESDAPVRMTSGLLSSEAYGVKTTASDMIRFIDANMNDAKTDDKLQRAILDTHTGYFKTKAMTQDVIWEQYPVPVQQNLLLDGNSKSMIYDANAVTQVIPPEKPRSDVWINKTGSTAGFGTYVAFVPKDQTGIVLLANKAYPISQRLIAAQEILKQVAARN
ncbi:MAG: beta-lactamase [Cyanobacteria bacterium SZAS-4]|nr:beta-lactamase [Cyanobacteria bacterium SZAS-4]